MQTTVYYWKDTDDRWNWIAKDEEGGVVGEGPDEGYSSKRYAQRGFRRALRRLTIGKIQEHIYTGNPLYLKLS